LKIAWRDRPEATKLETESSLDVVERTRLIDVVFRSSDFFRMKDSPDIWLFSNSPEAFCKNHNLLARDIVFLDCFADDFFGDSVRVDICCVPCIETTIVCSFEEW